MEKFSGNGAECMVQFIKDGGRGAIYKDTTTPSEPVIDRPAWQDNTSVYWSIDWLAAPCVYVSPEPVYLAATPGKALDAWLTGKEVQVQVWLDEALEGTKIRWDTVPRVPTERAPHWDVRRTYRIREE